MVSHVHTELFKNYIEAQEREGSDPYPRRTRLAQVQVPPLSRWRRRTVPDLLPPRQPQEGTVGIPLAVPSSVKHRGWTKGEAARVVELEAALQALLKAVGAIWSAEGTTEDELAARARQAENTLHRHEGSVKGSEC